MAKAKQYAEIAKRNHVDLKEKEYAIFAAQGKSDEAEAASNSYTDTQIAAVHQVPAGGSTGQVLTKIDGTDYNADWESIPPTINPANPTATAGPTAINGIAGTFMRSDAAPAIQKGSASQLGIVKPDGITITDDGNGKLTAQIDAIVSQPGLAEIMDRWPLNLDNTPGGQSVTINGLDSPSAMARSFIGF